VASFDLGGAQVSARGFAKPAGVPLSGAIEGRLTEARNEIAYHQGDFHVKDGQGNITDNAFPPFTYTANDQLRDGTLAASGTVSGDIIFQVPTGDHAAELTWQPNFFGAKAANVWLLGL
jgi:hypothetical protein